MHSTLISVSICYLDSVTSCGVTRHVLSAQKFCSESNQPTSAVKELRLYDYIAALIPDEHSFSGDQHQSPSVAQGPTVTEGRSLLVTGKPNSFPGLSPQAQVTAPQDTTRSEHVTQRHASGCMSFCTCKIYILVQYQL